MKEIKDLPLSRTSFSTIRSNNMIYVDKTDMIASIARANRNVAFFLGRPRRFGKTLLVNTFEDLFTNGLKNFKGLKIDTQNLWTDTKTYPVLHLDFSDFKNVNTIEQFNKKFYDNLLYFATKYNVEIINKTDDPVTLAKNIFEFFQNTSLVLLIDEYDSPLNASMLNSELFGEIRDVYSNFVSTVKTYEGKFRFIFITGITRYTHASIFSPFNIVYDLSLNPHYQTLLGYTDEELLEYFDDYLEEAAKAQKISKEELHQKLKEYYDGYYFTPDLTTNMYCPFSILNFFNYPDLGFKNYWNESGAGTQVVNEYFKKQPISCSEILKGFRVTEEEYNQGSDISSINYAVLLQQAGYYTFSEGSEEDDYVFSIPNKEVANTIYPIVFENDTGISRSNRTEIVRIVKKIVANLFDSNIEIATAEFNRILDFYGYDAFNNLMTSESVLRDNLLFVFTIALSSSNVNKSYTVTREEINLKGRADLVIDLNKKSKVVIELKVADSEEEGKKKLNEALEQIRLKDYGNNGIINPENIKRYGVVFYQDKATSKKLGVLVDRV